jgi:hypothetical protein
MHKWSFSRGGNFHYFRVLETYAKYTPTRVISPWYLDVQFPFQTVPIATNVVSSNPPYGEVYSIQHYVIKFVSDLRQVGGFLRVFRFPPPHDYEHDGLSFH